jgi:N-methylhydantoinase A
LNPDYFLGGEIKLYPERAHAAIEKFVARPLGMTTEEAAYGILRVVNANMVKGMSGSSIEKGFDPRDFTLLAFGGAGPLHACELAQEIGMRKVVIPLYPGALSAFGLVTSDIRHDYVQTIAKPAAALDLHALERAYKAMEAQARAALAEEKIAPEDVEIQWTADLRYAGQAYELNVPVNHNGHLTHKEIEATVTRFHALHQKVYAYSSEKEGVDVINVRLTGIGQVPDVKLPRHKRAAETARVALKNKRRVYFAGRGYVNVPVYERDLLKPGMTLQGPCMIEEIISSTVVIPGATAKLDAWGNIVISL